MSQILKDRVRCSTDIHAIRGYDGTRPFGAGTALERIQEGHRPDFVILDVLMPEINGLETLRQMMQVDRTLNVIMLSCSNEVATVVEAIRIGALDYLTKPFEKAELDASITLYAVRHSVITDLVTGGLGLAPAAPMNLGPQSEQSFDLDRPLREARDAFEKSYFEFHLAQENGSMTRVAEKTGLERTHLYRKLKQLGVDLSRNKRSLPL